MMVVVTMVVVLLRLLGERSGGKQQGDGKNSQLFHGSILSICRWLGYKKPDDRIKGATLQAAISTFQREGLRIET